MKAIRNAVALSGIVCAVVALHGIMLTAAPANPSAPAAAISKVSAPPHAGTR